MPEKETLFVNDGRELNVCAIGLYLEGVTLFPEEIRKATIQPSVCFEDRYEVHIYLLAGEIAGGAMSRDRAALAVREINEWKEKNCPEMNGDTEEE